MKTNLISDWKQSIVARAERTCSISHTWRILCATITLLLTLGVGNVWADDKGFYEVYMVYDKNGTEYNYTYNGSNGSMDLGTITSSFKIKKMYLKVWDDWSDQAFDAGQSGLGYKTQSGSDTDYKTNTRSSESDHNYELQHTNMNLTIASSTNPSGSYTFTHWWFADGTWTDTYYLKNGSSNCAFTYKIAPPAVKSGTLSVSATNVVSGTGTEGDPFVITYGSTTQFTVSGTQDHTDANSSIKGGFGTSTISSSATSSAYTPTTSAQSLTIYGAYVNSTTSSLKGASSNKTIYYKWADPAVPTLSMSSVSPTTLVEGNTVTINVTRSNSSAAISYEYKIGDGSWTSLTPASTSNNGQTATWAIPEAHGATRTFYFRATMSDGGTKTTAASDPVTVYGKKTIHVRNINNWANFYSYVYNYSAGSTTGKREDWPGSKTEGITTLAGQWKNVELTSQYTYFILNNGSSSNQLKGETYTYSGVSDDGYYTISQGSGSSLTLTSTTAPAAPTATTNDANEITSTTAKFNYSVNANRDKTTPGIAFKQSDDDIDAATIYSSGTKVAGSATNGNASGSTAAQTITPGKKYYYVAYGTNGFGTSYGTVKSFVAPYKVTITKPTGCSAITPDAGTQYVHIGDEISSTAATGYTFSSWSLSKVTLSSPTTTTGVTTSTITAISADNGAIQPVYTENMTTVNLIASPTGKGTFTSGGGAVTSVSAGVATHPEVTAVPATGYRLTGTIWSKSSDYISITPANAAATTITATGTTGNTANLTATFTPITYTVHFNANGGTGSMSNQTGIVYDSETTLTANAFTRTGYTFQGWATSEVRANAGTVDRTDGAAHDNLSSTQGATVNLYAVWQAKTYTVSFSQSGEGYSTGGQTASKTATYDADMPGSISLPTAANGYAFMGYYDNLEPLGTQYYTSTGASAHVWDKDEDATLYAYFKKAEITISLSDATVEKNATVTATATLDPVPEGEMAICWELLYYNTNLYCDDCFTPASGNSVTFEAPGISGTFIVKATLRNATCDGEEIDNTTTNLTIAGNHTVTIRYMGDGSQLQASTEMTAAPLVWSNEITAPTIFGYTFAGWTAGDGITITGDDGETEGTSSSETTIKIKATYEGTLTANYVETPAVYFYNNLGWSEVYVTYDAYWDESLGTGNYGKPYHKMTRIEGTNIWYDAIPSRYTSSGFSGWAHNIAFNSQQLGNLNEASNYEKFDKGKVIFRRDFDPYNTMFVPATTDTYTKNGATYYSSSMTTYNNYEGGVLTSIDYYYNGGYWKKYNSTYSGYSLRGTFAGVIGNETNWSGEEHNLYSETAEETAEGWVTTTSLPLNGNCNYDFRIYRNHLKNDCSSAYTNYGTMTISNHTNWRFETRQDWRSNNCTLKAATPGVYTFKVVFDKTGQIKVSVDYPMYAGDYRLLYKDDVHRLWHPSEAIHPGNEQDIVSFFSRTADKHPTLKWQYSTAISSTGTITWSTPADISLTGWVGADKAISENGVYNFILNYNASTHALTLADVKPYTGNYYIRTDCTGKNKWENYKNDPDHTMTYSEYSFSQETHPYSHYYTHWVDKDKDGGAYKNVKFVIANDYSPCISDTMTREEATGEWANIASYIDASGNLKRNANVRFMWNQSTNEISRAYIDGAQGTGSNIFLRLLSDDGKVYDLSDPAQVQASTAFTDNQNWIYEANVKANPNAQIRLLSTWGTTNTIQQYFKGTAAGGTETLIGGAGDTKFRIRLLYDFKTNRLVAAWLPDGEITETQEIEADVMIVRDHQNEGQTITFTEGAELQKVQTVYGAMKFNRWTLNNKSTATGHAVLPVAEQKSIYERSLYFISFPFDVKVSEIFGFGHYWDEWYIEYYDGLNRAKNGFWKDSEPNWKYVTPEMAKTYVLKANEGYILGLDLDYMADDNTTFWAHGIESVELFFPSTVDMETLQSTSFTMPALNEEYECKINRGTATGDRRVKDSYWRCIGVPGFSNYNSVLTKGKGGDDIQWQTNTEWRADFKDYPFLYSWNMTDNTLTAQSTKNFNFKCMHAYLVQNGNEIHWTAVSTKPSSIVRRSSAEANTLREYNWRLTLERNGETEDQTFVRMSNEENITDGFDFGQDLAKEENYGRSDIYTFIGYEHAAANSMPLHTGETTIVPVGVNVEKAGEYTFAMPEGTDGVGITLVDSETGTRTNLSAGLTYTLTLDKAEYTNRLHLEISPVKEVATGNDNIQSDDVQRTRKLLIDGILYIVKDGKVYTAQGQKAN